MGTGYGLLWFDNDPAKAWQQKVKDAAARLKAKKWVIANRCHVNYKDVGLNLGLNETAYIETIDGIAVYATYNTQRHNFYVFFVPPEPATQHQAAALPAQQLSLL